MKGLLYKDFVAIKGKWYVLGLLAVTGLFFLLYMLVGQNETGGVVLSMFFGFSFPVMMIVAVPSLFENAIFAGDEGKNCKEYILSMPVSKKDYISAKYVFLLIAYYVVISVSEFWCSILGIYESVEVISGLVTGVMNMLPLLVCVSLIITAIELPFYIQWGRKKGGRIKEVCLILLFFGIIVYLLFGDLTVLDRFELTSILDYMEEHPDVFIQLNIYIPILAFVFYYLSYKISSYLFGRGEWNYES